MWASLFGLSAMGVQSALVRLLIKGCPSTNVMTTNTTLFAIDVTELAMTWRARRRAPTDARITDEHARIRERFAALWPTLLGFLVGTIGGAAAYGRLDLWCLLPAIGVIVALAVWTARTSSA